MLEGSIKLSLDGSHKERLLKPGEQAVVAGSVLDVSNVDVEQAVDWKNGDFIFQIGTANLVNETCCQMVQYTGGLRQWRR